MAGGNTHTTAPYGTAANTSGDVGYKTAMYMENWLLKRAQEEMVLERFGQAKTLPQKKTKTIGWRRYNSLAPAMQALTEGVTPDGVDISYTDINASLDQYGSLMKITDVLADTYEDAIVKEMSDLMGEQAADTIEYLRWKELVCGTNVLIAGGGASRHLAKVPLVGDFRNAYRNLRRNRGKFFTSVIKASPNVGTTPVPAGYYAVCHPDMEPALRAINEFIPAERYGNSSQTIPGEIGAIEKIRIVTSTFAEPFALGNSAGVPAATADTVQTMTTDGGSTPYSVVYPIVVFARNAYGTIALQGKNSMQVTVLNPGTPSKSDPLGQRGYVSWKTYNATKILNDAFMVRIEALASDEGEGAGMQLDYYGAPIRDGQVGDFGLNPSYSKEATWKAGSHELNVAAESTATAGGDSTFIRL